MANKVPEPELEDDGSPEEIVIALYDPAEHGALDDWLRPPEAFTEDPDEQAPGDDGEMDTSTYADAVPADQDTSTYAPDVTQADFDAAEVIEQAEEAE